MGHLYMPIIIRIFSPTELPPEQWGKGEIIKAKEKTRGTWVA